MKIVNISQKRSIKSTIMISFLCFAFVYIMIALYAYTTENSYSITDFFSWYFSAFKSFLFGFEGYIVAFFIFFVLPIALCVILVTNIIEKIKAKRDFNSSLNLESVEFLQGRVNFRFNKPQYNLTCSYADINSLEMVLHTIIIHWKSRSYPAVNEVELNFTILNNKTFSISCIPISITSFVYAIIDYSRGVQHFSYRFKGGGGEITSIKERIENYSKKGLKQILTSKEEANLKLISIAFFITGCIYLFFILAYYDFSLSDCSWFMFILPAIFIFISLFFDLVLIVSKISEKMYGQK